MRTRDDRRLTDRLLILASLVACAFGALAMPTRANAQGSSGTVVGRIIDGRTNDGIANVSVQIEGTRLGGATGPDGRYRLTGVPAGSRTLVALRLGYASARRTVAVTAGQDVTTDITMQVSAISLDQVVVTGTAGTTEKRSIGNVVSTIDAATELQKSAAPDISNLLRARTPGLDVLPVSGRIGAGPVIQIRGPSSIGLSNSPLIYIDGVRINNAVAQGPASVGAGALGTQGAAVANRLNDINPDDIETIEIIKGPAAATIYGTEAANG
ncbi:MAG TPA: TonB-dependent receptor plug domain-containing protein, partial [Gemmatimonadaceae bacterium]